MNTKEIMNNLMNLSTGGYFYKDNCRINYSSIYGWYCKDYQNKKIKTYIITENKAVEIIDNSLVD